MTRRLPVRRPPAQPVRYLETATPSELARQVSTLLDPNVAALQEQRDRQLYLRWKTRQDAIRKKDEKVRRFWLGFGAVLGLAFLATLILLGWLLWTVVGLGALAIPALFGLACIAGVGGHRCITIVQHWH